jgi:hypothetical protein
VERLLLSKELLGPIRFSPVARPDRITLARHILTAHDAAELALAGIAHHLNQLPSSQQIHLMDYFPAIAKIHPEKSVEGKEYFNQLNRVRIGIKHHGVFPDPQQWYRVGERTYDYVSQWCECYLGLPLDELDESSLLSDPQVKNYFEEARDTFSRGNYRDTLEKLGLAMYTLFRNSAALWGLAVGVSQAEHAIKLSAFGVNANDYLTLQEFLPRVIEGSKEGVTVEWEQKKFGHPGNWRKVSADFCLRTFLSIAKRIQDTEWIPGP